MTPADIRRIIAAGGPTVVYQPIVSIIGVRHAPAKVEGYEALARFDDEHPPNLWFDAAHAEGLGVDLEMVAVRNAVDEFRRRLGGFRADLGYLTVNLSPKALLDPTVQEFLLSDAEMPIHLVVELSESQVVADYDAVQDVVVRLRHVGVALAIDDLGAGFSSLLHVMHLRPEYVKIDRQLIDRLPADEFQISIVNVLVGLGRAIGARVIAEGVESQAQADTLRILGVTSGQGWFYGMPGPLPA